MRGPLHTFFLVLIICLVQFFTVATLKILDAGGNGGGTPGPSSGGLDDCVAGDVNNDAALNIADAIYVLSYLFTSGPEPVACAGNPTEVVITGSADVNVINTPTVSLSGPADVNVTNTPTVNIGNVGDFNTGNNSEVQVTNIPEVIVTNTADMNIVNVPTVSVVELQGTPTVSVTGALEPGNAIQLPTGSVNSSTTSLVFTVPDGQTLYVTEVHSTYSLYATNAYLEDQNQTVRIGFGLGGAGNNQIGYAGGASPSVRFFSPVKFNSGDQVNIRHSSFYTTASREFWVSGYLTSN